MPRVEYSQGLLILHSLNRFSWFVEFKSWGFLYAHPPVVLMRMGVRARQEVLVLSLIKLSLIHI